MAGAEKLDERYVYEAVLCAVASLALLIECIYQLWIEYATQHRERAIRRRYRGRERHQRYTRRCCGCTWKLGDLKWVIRRASTLTAIVCCIRSLDPSAVFGILNEYWLLTTGHVIVFNLAWSGITQVFLTIDVAYRSSGRFSQPPPPFFGFICAAELMITGVWVLIGLPTNMLIYDPRVQDSSWSTWVMVLELVSLSLLVYAEIRLSGVMAPVILERSRSAKQSLLRRADTSRVQPRSAESDSERALSPTFVESVAESSLSQSLTSKELLLSPDTNEVVLQEEVSTSVTQTSPSAARLGDVRRYERQNVRRVASEAAAAGDSFAKAITKMHRETRTIAVIIIMYLPVQAFTVYRQLTSPQGNTRFMPERNDFEYLSVWTLGWIIQSLLTAVALWYSRVPLPPRARFWYCEWAKRMPCTEDDVRDSRVLSLRGGQQHEDSASGTEVDSPRSLRVDAAVRATPSIAEDEMEPNTADEYDGAAGTTGTVAIDTAAFQDGEATSGGPDYVLMT